MVWPMAGKAQRNGTFSRPILEEAGMNDKNEYELDDDLGWGAIAIAFICIVVAIVAMFSIFVTRP